MSSTSTEDLRQQLKDLQSRLYDTAKLGSTLQSAESELSLHIKKLEDKELSKDEAAQSTESLQTKLRRIQRDYEDYVGKSSPVVSPSKSSRFLSSFSPSKDRAASKPKRASQSSEDVQFATNISETLIAECRKLKMELYDKNSQLAEQAEKQSRLQKETTELKALVDDLRRAETQIKDENWDLEVKIQELQSKMSDTDATVAKISNERGKLSSLKDDQVNQIESLKTREAELEQDLQSIKSQHDALVSSLQNDKRGLEQENATLQSNLTDLRNELTSVSAMLFGNASNEEGLSSLETSATTTDEEHFKTPTNSPPLSPVQPTSRGTVLENETIKSSLQHSHRQLANLRNHMMKERSEKLDLKRQLTQMQNELENAKNTTIVSNSSSVSVGSSGSSAAAGGVRTKRSKFFAKQTAAVKRATSRLDTSASLSDEGLASSSGIYATAESGEEFHSAFETAREDVAASTTTTEDEFQTSNETADEGEDTETEQENVGGTRQRGNQGFFNEDPALESTASISSSDDDSDLSSRVTSRRSRNKKSVHTLRPLSEMLDSHSDSTPLKQKGSLASEYLSPEELNKYAELHGLAVIDAEEHNKLKEFLAGTSNLDLIKKLADKEGVDVVVAKDMKTHVQDNVAPKFGLVAVTKEEYTHLKDLKDHPSTDFVRNAVDAVGLVALTKDEHEQLTKVPTKDEVIAHAKNYDLKAITTKEHDRLVRDSTRVPTKEEVEIYAKDMGLLAIPADEYFGLVRYRDSPSPQSVEELASKIGLVTVDQNSFNLWKEPTADFLQAKASPLGMLMVDKVQYKNLGRLASNPSAQEIKERAEKVGLHVLPESEFKDLSRELSRELTRDEVSEKADAHGAILVDKEEYQNIRSLALEPPADHLKEKAGLLGLTSVPISLFEELKAKAETPDANHIKSKAAALGLTVDTADHYRNLHDRIANPSLDEIHAHAKNKGLVLLDSESHKNLEKPSIEALKTKASQQGHVVIPEESYGQLKKLSDNPTKEDVLSAATKVGDIVVLDSSQYDELKNREPTKQELQILAEKYGLVALPVQQFEKLSKDANVTVDKSFVESAAAGLGLVTLTSAALKKLQGPSLPDLGALASKHGHTVVSNQELAALKQPDTEKVRDYAKDHGLVTLTSSEQEGLLKENESLKQQLQKPYEVESQDEVERFASKFNLITVPEAVYKQLTASPTKEKVAADALSLGLTSVTMEELEELKSRPKEFNPTQEELSAIVATKFGAEIVPKSKLKELQQMPSRETLEAASTEYGLSVVPTSTLEELKRQATEPSQKELDIMAARLSLAVVPTNTIQEMHEQLINPSEEYLRNNSKSKYGLKLIAEDELFNLKRRAEEPSLEELKEYSAKKLNATIVPTAEYEELSRQVKEPSIDDIKHHGDNLGHVVVARDVYEELEKNATEPDKDTVAKFAKRLGLTAIAETDLHNLRMKSSNAPTLAELETYAKKYNMVLTRQDDASGVITSESGPSSPVSEKDMHLQSLAVKRNYFEDRIRQEREGTRPTVDKKVIDTMKSLGYVPVAQDEYKQLMDSQKVYSPSRADIIRAAKTFGLTTIPSDEYKSLLRRNNNRMSVSSFDTVAPSSNAGDSRSSTPEPPSTSPRKDSGPSNDLEMKTVLASYLASLQRIAENPTEEEVLNLAKKVGLPLGGAATLAAENPPNKSTARDLFGSSVDEVKAKARELDLVPLTSQEYNELRHKPTLSPEEIEAGAEKVGLVTLTKDEYQRLNTKKAEPSSSDIRATAREMGLVTLTSEEFNQLQQQQQQQQQSEPTETDIKSGAEKLGLVTLAVGEYTYLKEPNATRVESEAEKLGLVTVPTNVYKSMAERAAAHGPLSDGEVRAHADKLGLLVMNKEQLEEKVQNRLVNSPTPALDRDTLEARARELGLVVLDKENYKHLSSATVTGNGGRTSEDRLLDEEPELRYKEVKYHASPVYHHAPRNFVAGEHATPGAVSQESLNARPPHAPLPSVSESGYNEGSSGNSGTSASPDKFETAVSAATAAALGASGAAVGSVVGSVRNIATGAAVDYQRQGSLLNLSNMTIASQASFTDRTMIPLITQVVIGEFLYKYTRRVAISGISDTRHERYFWIHPYSLTIHWTKENPGSQSYKNPKTKSAAILAVKSVEDTNPLPPGLYSKSIEITTNSRTLKLTCLNRRRHNIWYNAIQYLIKRSTEELSFDEDLEGEFDNYTADSHIENERARTASQTTHRSSSRVLSIRRSMAPEMNNGHIRHLQAGPPVVSSPTTGHRASSFTQTPRQPSVSSFRTPSLMPPSQAHSHRF